MIVLVSVLAATLVALSALHGYWVLGGRVGLDTAIPQVNDQPVFTPGPIATLLVAVLLLAAALILMGRTGVITFGVPNVILWWLSWAVSATFLARAVGDFRLCGFFKRVHGTRFAYWDTRLYSPLCLGLGLGAAIVAYG